MSSLTGAWWPYDGAEGRARLTGSLDTGGSVTGDDTEEEFGTPRPSPQAGPLMTPGDVDRLYEIGAAITAEHTRHAEALAPLAEERAVLLCQLHADGLSYREIGALADISWIRAREIVLAAGL